LGNLAQTARSAYFKDTATQLATRSSKSLEYDIIARITYRLAEASRHPKEGFSQLAKAMHENRQLWNAFAADVFSGGNHLSPELKANIVYLSEFVAVHSQKVLDGSASPRTLVEINLATLKGLKASETNR
jgi:flagellar protein FlaF